MKLMAKQSNFSISKGRSIYHLSKPKLVQGSPEKLMNRTLNPKNASNVQNFESSFRKNYSKVEFNIKKGPIQHLKHIKSLKRIKNNPSASSFRRIQSRQTNSNQCGRPNFRMTAPHRFFTDQQAKPSAKQEPIQAIYPRFRMLQLRALYNSIIEYSKNDPRKLFVSLESSLIYNRIMVKPETLMRSLFSHKQLDFEAFLLLYKRMEDLMLIQSLIDYIQIIFEPTDSQRLTESQVYQLLLKRSSKDSTETITKLIFEKLGVEKGNTVRLQDILQLCEKDIEFCSVFAKLYYHQQEKQSGLP